MTADLRLVGVEELSASALRTRLLARSAQFWAGSPLGAPEVHELHDPLFFHQLGGFGAVALTGDDEDAGYLLGVVSVDRLAVLHALAVHPTWRRQGLATRLVDRFVALSTRLGARVAQAVAPADDPAVWGLAERLGATAALSPAHAGPGADRLVLTRFLTNP